MKLEVGFEDLMGKGMGGKLRPPPLSSPHRQRGGYLEEGFVRFEYCWIWAGLFWCYRCGLGVVDGNATGIGLHWIGLGLIVGFLTYGTG